MSNNPETNRLNKQETSKKQMPTREELEQPQEKPQEVQEDTRSEIEQNFSQETQSTEKKTINGTEVTVLHDKEENTCTLQFKNEEEREHLFTHLLYKYQSSIPATLTNNNLEKERNKKLETLITGLKKEGLLKPNTMLDTEFEGKNYTLWDPQPIIEGSIEVQKAFFAFRDTAGRNGGLGFTPAEQLDYPYLQQVYDGKYAEIEVAGAMDY